MDRGGHPHSPILSSCPCPAYDGGGHAAGELARSFSFSPPTPTTLHPRVNPHPSMRTNATATDGTVRWWYHQFFRHAGDHRHDLHELHGAGK